MIHFDTILNKWQFNLPNHNLNKNNRPLIYNQLFLENKLYILNIKTGEIYINTVDLNRVNLLKLYNFHPDSNGRFITRKDRQMIYIYQLICGLKTNQNYVINHIDGNPTNNVHSNLELVTNWFNIILKKKKSTLPIGINYTSRNNIYQTAITMPKVNGRAITFSSKSIDYLQNIHYQFATKSELVSCERYLQETLNWLPDNNIVFLSEHQQKLDMLITVHLQNQKGWIKPIEI